jgi:hypothetical protein
MNERIVIGLISGLVVSVGAWVWHSDFFTKTQKIIIIISLLFPPGALAVIILISIYNNVTKPNRAAPNPTVTQPTKDLSVLEESLVKVKELHEKGIFTDSELNEKTSELEKKIQTIKEAKIHQSLESKVKESEEYKALVVLRSSQVIDGEEFDRKVKKLVDEYLQKASSAHQAESTTTEVEVDSNDDLIPTVIFFVIIAIGALVIMAALGTT